MNKQIEALKMAIETMEFYIGNGDNDLDKSIQACKEALAEAEQKQKQEEAFAELVKLSQEMGGYEAEKQEPVAWMDSEEMLSYFNHDKTDIPLYTHPAQAEKQGSVAKGFIRTLISVDKDGIETWKEEPFYTHPVTWQSLSDDEIKKIYVEIGVIDFKDLVRAIEQALKKKNI